MQRIVLQQISKVYRNHDGEVTNALSNISFTVEKGEAIGVFGKNGSGKSTLMNIIGGYLKPTSGRAEVNGNTAALLGIGIGFHPDLSGEENYYLKGQLLGMRKSDLKTDYENMVSFSGLADYVKRPIRTYSNGMFMRLAFSTAVFQKADIYLFDEVLAVGDTDFRLQCYEKIKQLLNEGACILTVSHNVTELLALCSRYLILEKGRLVEDSNDANKLLHFAYKEKFSEMQQQAGSRELIRDTIVLKDLTVNGLHVNPHLAENQEISVCLNLGIIKWIDEPLNLMLIFRHQFEIPVYSIHTIDNVCFNMDIADPSNKEIRLNSILPAGTLNFGIYSLTVFAQRGHRTYKIDNASIFQINQTISKDTFPPSKSAKETSPFTIDASRRVQ